MKIEIVYFRAYNSFRKITGKYHKLYARFMLLEYVIITIQFFEFM